MSETYTPERKNRQRNTNLKKYGVENVFCKNSPIRKKFEEKWKEEGYINPFSREDVKEKIKQTCLKKYGVEYSGQSKQKIENTKKSNLEKYGVKNTTQLESVKKKMEETCLKKYGVKHCMQNKSIKEKADKTFIKNHDGMTPPEYMKIHIKKSLTKPHKKILDILQEFNISFEIEYKINNFYVDIFIEKFNLIIEIYGDYWHANPIKYKEDDILTLPGKQIKVNDLWMHDKMRINSIKNKRL